MDLTFLIKPIKCLQIPLHSVLGYKAEENFFVCSLSVEEFLVVVYMIYFIAQSYQTYKIFNIFFIIFSRSLKIKILKYTFSLIAVEQRQFFSTSSCEKVVACLPALSRSLKKALSPAFPPCPLPNSVK